MRVQNRRSSKSVSSCVPSIKKAVSPLSNSILKPLPWTGAGAFNLVLARPSPGELFFSNFQILPFKLDYFQVIQHLIIQALNDLLGLFNSLLNRYLAFLAFMAEFYFDSAFF